jgi:hypothetical protein
MFELDLRGQSSNSVTHLHHVDTCTTLRSRNDRHSNIGTWTVSPERPVDLPEHGQSRTPQLNEGMYSSGRICMVWLPTREEPEKISIEGYGRIRLDIAHALCRFFCDCDLLDMSIWL